MRERFRAEIADGGDVGVGGGEDGVRSAVRKSEVLDCRERFLDGLVGGFCAEEAVNLAGLRRVGGV